jgi:glycosyltransferase involved in cell wall biosynthesis
MRKLTIITINYNNREGLVKTINSIMNQSFTDFEFIVIDGGSTDGSVEECEKCPIITKWISEKDNGVYHAMNKGIKMAEGTYINFMNSGDEFHNKDVLAEISGMLESDVDIFYGNTVYYNSNNYRREEIPPSELSFFYLYEFGINHQASFIKRSLFYDSFFYNETYKICSDWEFFMYNLCLRNVTYKHVNTFICNYDFSGISADPKNLKLYHDEKEQMIKRYFPLFYKDLKVLKEAKSKRLQQILHIKENKFAWRIMKWIVSILLLITGKPRKS